MRWKLETALPESETPISQAVSQASFADEICDSEGFARWIFDNIPKLHDSRAVQEDNPWWQDSSWVPGPKKFGRKYDVSVAEGIDVSSPALGVLEVGPC